MKKFTSEWREKGKVIYLVIFLGMIIPAILSYYAAEADNFPLMVIFLGLVLLANLFALI
jgi:hypothetical protein